MPVGHVTNPAAGLKALATAAVSAMPWVRWFKADAITGLNDGDKVASWVDSAGSGDPAVQATLGNKPAYTASSINSLPAVTFVAGKNLATLHGGTALGGATTPWYMAAVFKFSAHTGFPTVVSFGDDVTSGHRRSILYNSSVGALEFNGNGADGIPPGATVVNGTAYFYEVIFDGANLFISINGVLRAPCVPDGALGSSTADPIVVGDVPGTGFAMTGDISEIFILGRQPTFAEQLATRAYVASKYALSFPAPVALVAGSSLNTSSSHAAENAGLVVEANTKFGTTADILVGLLGIQSGFTAKANHAFRGVCAWDSTGAGASGNHLMISNTSNGVLNIQNANGGAYGAIAVLNSQGYEICAFGGANKSAGAAFVTDSTQGNHFLEFSGFQDGTVGGSGVLLVQTNSALNTGLPARRIDVNHAGEINYYDGSAAVGTRTMKIYPNGVIQYTGMTTTAINALTAAEGMTVYDSTLHVWKFYNGTAWKTITTN